MRPVIGITPDFHPGHRKGFRSRGESTYFIRARYVDAVQDLGGVPLILPATQEAKLRKGMLSRIDGLLITGSGPDLNPRLYGERQTARFKIMSAERSEFELCLAREAIREGCPILGICGGLQLLNVALGGSLIQDIETAVPRALPHQQEETATRVSHRVRITPGTRLHRILRSDTIRVNSSHHQAPKGVAPGLMVNAMAPDGIIEGLESAEPCFVIGIQWHPEYLYRRNEASRRLFKAFLKESAKG